MSQLSENKKLEWGKHIHEQRASGMSQSAYCQRHDLILHQFGYWKRKFDSSQGFNSDLQPQVKSSGFVPVTMASIPTIDGLSVTLPNGLVIHGLTEANCHLAQCVIGVLI